MELNDLQFGIVCVLFKSTQTIPNLVSRIIVFLLDRANILDFLHFLWIPLRNSFTSRNYLELTARSREFSGRLGEK